MKNKFLKISLLVAILFSSPLKLISSTNSECKDPQYTLLGRGICCSSISNFCWRTVTYSGDRSLASGLPTAYDVETLGGGSSRDNIKCKLKNAYICAQQALDRALARRTPEEIADSSIQYKIFKCSSQNRAILRIKYGTEDYLLKRFSPFSDSIEWEFIEQRFDKIPKFKEEELVEFFCRFDFKKFLKTKSTGNLSIEHFIQGPLEKREARSHSEMDQTVSRNTIDSSSTTPSDETSNSPENNLMTSSSHTSSSQNKLLVKKHSSGDLEILGEPFYARAVSATLRNTRRLLNKDETKEILITFSSSNKNSFLQKLQKQFDSFQNKETKCQNGNTLFEVAGNGLYKAFLLHPSAIVVLTERYDELPSSNQLFVTDKQTTLCNINPLTFY